MNLNRINSEINRQERNKLNENWQLIEQGIDEAKEVANALLDAEIDTAALQTDIRNKLNQLEQNYAPELSSLSSQLADIENLKTSLIIDSNFQELPYISSRSSVYSFAIDSVIKHLNNNSLRIKATNYESSSDQNKDFAMVLTEMLLPGEKIRVSFWVYPKASNKTLIIRPAYGNGKSVNLGNANEWKRIDTLIDFTGTRGSNYLYFDLLSSQEIFISELSVVSESNKVDNVSKSFNEINEKLLASPFKVQNSLGMISRLIEVAQTYQSNIQNLTYGNSYTAFDSDITQVGGKYQMDCSSFVNLMIGGTTYNNSRYSQAQNDKSKLFFHEIDGYKYRYANNMAKYAFEKGYAFKPNEDFSNIEPGDVLFFSWESGSGAGDTPAEARKSAFMKIDHVAIALQRKNESFYSTIQYYPNATTVFYDADNNYIQQCVLAARFPFANIENECSNQNIVVNGSVRKQTNNSTDIGFYRLSEALIKGQFYTLFINGQINTPNAYFTVMVNNKTVYSDTGKVNPYNGLAEIRFPYLLDDISRDIKISIGAPSGTSDSRSGVVNWCSLYKGYISYKRFYEQPVNSATISDVTLTTGLTADLDSNLYPHYKYAVEGNKIFLNLSLPFNTTRTGNLTIGTIPENTIITTQRISASLVDENNQAVNAILQINPSGSLVVINYSSSKSWKRVLVNGCVFRE